MSPAMSASLDRSAVFPSFIITQSSRSLCNPCGPHSMPCHVHYCTPTIPVADGLRGVQTRVRNSFNGSARRESKRETQPLIKFGELKSMFPKVDICRRLWNTLECVMLTRLTETEVLDTVMIVKEKEIPKSREVERAVIGNTIRHVRIKICITLSVNVSTITIVHTIYKTEMDMDAILSQNLMQYMCYTARTTYFI